jgi:hypothetical protein
MKFIKSFQKSNSKNSTDDGGQTMNKNNIEVVEETKMSKAMAVYQRMITIDGVKRKDIIQSFKDECDLTDAGAKTYYSNIKKKLSQSH